MDVVAKSGTIIYLQLTQDKLQNAKYPTRTAHEHTFIAFFVLLPLEESGILVSRGGQSICAQKAGHPVKIGTYDG